MQADPTTEQVVTFASHVAATEQALSDDTAWQPKHLVHCLLDPNDPLAQNVHSLARMYPTAPVGSVTIPLGVLMDALPFAARSFYVEGMIGCCVVVAGQWSLWSHEGVLIASGRTRPAGDA